MRTLLSAVVLLTALSGCSSGGLSSNENLNVQLSHASSEVNKHTGVILYGGYSFELVRVRIEGIDYIANSKGGLVRESSEVCE